MPYDDGGVACTEEALVIRRYYFPFGDKRIPYAKIEHVRRVPLTVMGGKYQIWGSGDFIHWFNFDPGRPGKSAALIIQVSGSRIQPVITPRDTDSAIMELTAHGVQVTTG